MIYLGGGGSETDEALIWDLAFEAGQRVVVWPFAMPQARWDGTKKWITDSLAPRGEFAVSLGLGGPDFGLDGADIVAIPGGNTFRLLDHLQKNNLLPALRKFLNKGGRIYGGSAGALILGASIAIADSSVGGQDDSTAFADLKDMQGLDALGGCVTYPHFELDIDSFAGHCHRWSQEHNVTVIGMPETCGIRFDPSGLALNAGPSRAYVFTPDGHRLDWAPDATLFFPLRQ